MKKQTMSWGVLALSCAVLAACGGEAPEQEADAGSEVAGAPDRAVVLYTGEERAVVDRVTAVFEQRTGIEVVVVAGGVAPGSPEPARRLMDEREAPQGDVWWSPEPWTTAELAAEGVLAPFSAERAHEDFGGGWPSSLRAQDGTWYGFAQRARAIAYDARAVDDPPRALRDLAEPAWRGKVGMARPRSGTTAGHLAALVHLWGEGPTRSWLEAMEANDLRLYDSEAAVVRAIADGEIALGLTDTDEVWSAQANGWPVELVYERTELSPGEPLAPGSVPPLAAFGALSIPSTVARVAGGPNEAEAAELLEFLLSAEGERLLMGGDALLVPLRPELRGELAAEFPATVVESPAEPDIAAVAAEVGAARDLAREVLGL